MKNKTTLRKDMILSDATIDDISVGDVCWVNYPYEEDEQKDDNGDSTMGKLRPCVVIEKSIDNDRPLLIVKGTTSKNKKYNDDKYIRIIHGIRFNISRVATLKPHHFIGKLFRISKKNKKFKNLVKDCIELYKKNKAIHATYENYIFNEMKTPIIEGKFYRLTYNGKGIYSALKEASGMSWKRLLKDPDITWLPKPPEYKGDYRSYFTEHGYHMYRIKTSKIMDQYLDKKHIKVTEYSNLRAYVAYRDKYQIVVSKDYVADKDVVIKTGNGLIVDEETNSFMSIDESKDTPWIMSQDDIYIGYDRWKNKDSNILFVTGISGSGKSTIAQKIAKRDHATYVELDHLAFMITGNKAKEKGRLNWDYISDKDDTLYMYMRKTGKSPDYLVNIGDITPKKPMRSKKDEAILVDEIENYIRFLIRTGNRYVICGGYVANILVKCPDLRDYPVVFKGTSISKAFYRRCIRDGITIDKMAIRVRQYKGIVSDMNKARNIMLDKDYETIPEEDIQEATNIKVPSGINNFKDFCSKIKNPEMAMKWFVKNKVRWTKGGNDNPFQWPDQLIKDKMGNCFDQSVFMHYFLKHKRISHKLFFITWEGKDKNIATGHVIPTYEKGGYVYAWLYVNQGFGYIGGPFESYSDCKDHMDKFFAVTVNGILKTPTYPYSSYMSDEDLLNFDRYYGRTDITQDDFIRMGAGINMRSTHMMKIKFKGVMFPNPSLPVYDAIVAFASLMKSNGKVAESVCVSSGDVITEDKLSADERTDFGLPKKKKYPMPDEAHVRAAIRFFNHCDPEDEAELARNIKKYMKKYNMKDVNVGDDNRFKKYYKGSSVNEDAVTDSMYFKRSANGIDNAIVDINGAQYRPRAEILVFNSDGEVYLTVDKDLKKNQYGNVYKIPGGGFDKPDETPEQTSARECKEEIRIVPKDVVYTGETYIKEYGTNIPEWHKDKLWSSGIKYRGAITYVCVGKVSKEFKGYIKPVDRDEVMMSGRFYKKDEAMKYLSDIHKKVCNDYKWGKYNKKG